MAKKKDKFSSRNADMNYTYMDDNGAIVDINLATKVITNSNYTAGKKIKDITLIDSTVPIEVLGSKIKDDAEKNPNIDNFNLPDIDTGDVLNDTIYKIYGSPEKWIFDNHQQYNNCGIVSCLNTLVMAGKLTIKDQNKTEKQFTQKMFDLGYGDDDGVFGVLDQADGGTTLNDYMDILKMYDIDSDWNFYGYTNDEYRYYESHEPATIGELAERIEEGKGIIISVSADILWGDIKLNANIYTGEEIYEEKIMNASLHTYTEANVGSDTPAFYTFDGYRTTTIPADAKFERVDDEIVGEVTVDGVAKRDKTDITDVIEILKKSYGSEYSSEKTYYAYKLSDEVPEEHISANYAFICKEDIESYDEAELNHAICVTGVVRDSDNYLIGFYIHDTGAWATRYISINDLSEAALANTYITLVNPPPETDPNVKHNIFCITTNDDIRALTDPTVATGNNLDNTITGNYLSNLIKAQQGNDTVYGKSGDDTIYGGAGDDVLYGESENDLISDDDGKNKIYGDAGNDKIYGGSKDDSLDGGKGNDSIIGYSGNDLIKGGAGDDTLYGDNDNDTIYGGAGNDTIHGNTDNDWLYGDAGNDELYGDTGNDIIYGGAGDDTIHGNEDNDIIYGGAGNDDLNGEDGDDKIYGQSGQNYITGGNGDDTLIGGTGADNIEGDDGDDCISGGKGNDDLKGEDGDDIISGDAGNDILNGGDGDDTIYGDSYKINYSTDPDKRIPTGSGNDTIKGGEGNDRIYACGGNDIIYTEDNDGWDKIDFGSGTTTYVINNHSYGLDTIGTSASKSTAILQYDVIQANELEFSYNYDAGVEEYYLLIKETDLNSLVYFNFKSTSKLKTYVKDETNTQYLLTASAKDNGTVSVGDMKSNNILVTAAGGSNQITTSSHSDIVYMAGGDDTITYTGGEDYYLSTEGDDIYNCSLYNENTILSITDGDGDDTLNITSDINNVGLFWDMTKTGEYTDNKTLYLMNKTVFGDGTELNNGEAVLNKFAGNIGGSIDISEYFGSGKIEDIYCDDEELLITTEYIDSISEQVSGWFSEVGHTGYDSVQDVLDTYDSDLVSSLLQCYTINQV